MGETSSRSAGRRRLALCALLAGVGTVLLFQAGAAIVFAISSGKWVNAIGWTPVNLAFVVVPLGLLVGGVGVLGTLMARELTGGMHTARRRAFGIAVGDFIPTGIAFSSIFFFGGQYITAWWALAASILPAFAVYIYIVRSTTV